MISLVDGTWTRICDSGQLAVGDRREVLLPNGRLALLMRTENRLTACPADCPHQDTPLLDALIDGDTLTCPTHYWQWDLATGEPLGVAEMRLSIYPVMEDENGIHIHVLP